MKFMVLHSRHHKVSQSVPFFMQHKTVTILLRIRVRGHFVMLNIRYHKSHYATLLGQPSFLFETVLNFSFVEIAMGVHFVSYQITPFLTRSFNLSHLALCYGIISIENSMANHIEPLSDHNAHDWPPVTKDLAPEVAFLGMAKTVN